MSSVLVTAMYNGLSDTEHGGRNRDKMYLDSLKSLNDMHHPIICFVDPRTHIYNKWCFEELGMQYVTPIPFDIFSHNLNYEIVRIKRTYPEVYEHGDDFWRHRCVQLMWSKTRMIKSVIELYGTEIENIFWMDAGLSNDAIIRHKYFRERDNDEHYKSIGLFIPRFVFNLVKYADDKILALLHTQPHNSPIPRKYNKTDYRNNSSMIGGLFGGNKNKMLEFCNLFEEYLPNIIASDELYSEESIYSGILNDNKDMFSTMAFDTFYHKDWGSAFNPDNIPFTSVIEKFIETEIVHVK